MANIWLPAETDIALALREPNLLVPGRKPIRSTYIPDGSPELAQGLTAYWSFLPNLDNAFQSHIKSAGDREFTKDAYTWTTSDTVDSYDEIGHFAGMSAATGYAKTGSDSAVRLSGTKATFYCWARLVYSTLTSGWAFGNIQTVTSNGYNWGIYVGGTNKDIVGFAKTTGGVSAVSLSPSVINWGDGKPHFVVVVLDGSNCIVEVDGVYTNSSAQTSGLFTTSDFSISFNRWLTQSAQGFYYYSAGVYPSRALNAAERQELFRRRGVFLKNTAANDTPYLFHVAGGGGASVTVPAKAFSLTTSAPAVSTGASVAVPAKAFSLTLTAPTIQAGANTVVNVPAKVYALTTAAPGVSTGVAVAVPAKQFSLFATAPAVATGVSVAVPAKAYGITLSPPTIDAGLSTVISAPAKAYSLVATAPSLSTGVSVGVPAKGFSLSLVAPTIATGVRLSIPAKAFSLVLTAPAVSQPDTIVLTAKPEYSLAIAPYRGTLQGR